MAIPMVFKTRREAREHARNMRGWDRIRVEHTNEIDGDGGRWLITCARPGETLECDRHILAAGGMVV